MEVRESGMNDANEAALRYLRQRNSFRKEVKELKAENARLREALETFPKGHNHWDPEGTNGLNCSLCNAQREHIRQALKGEK